GQEQRDRDADPAQRAAATGAAGEHAPELVDQSIEGPAATATATAARRPGILAAAIATVAARTAVVVVLAGDVPGHAGSSLGIPPPGSRRRKDILQGAGRVVRPPGGACLFRRQERAQRSAVLLRRQPAGIAQRQVDVERPAVFVVLLAADRVDLVQARAQA